MFLSPSRRDFLLIQSRSSRISSSQIFSLEWDRWSFNLSPEISYQLSANSSVAAVPEKKEASDSNLAEKVSYSSLSSLPLYPVILSKAYSAPPLVFVRLDLLSRRNERGRSFRRPTPRLPPSPRSCRTSFSISTLSPLLSTGPGSSSSSVQSVAILVSRPSKSSLSRLPFRSLKDRLWC